MAVIGYPMADTFQWKPPPLQQGGLDGARGARISGTVDADVGTFGWATIRGTATISETGAIRSGANGYDDGVGFHLEANSGTPRFFLGNSSGNKMTWDGSTLAVTGSFTISSGSVGGWTVSSTALTGGSATLHSSGYLLLGSGNDIVRADAADATYRLWAGNSTAASAPFRVTKAGAITSTSFTIQSATSGARVELLTTGVYVRDSGGTVRAQLLSDGSGYLGASNKISWDTSGNVTINATTASITNLSFTNLSSTGTLGAGQNLGTNNLTINSSGRLYFGGGSLDYLGNDKLHFDVTTSEEALLEYRDGTTSTYYSYVSGRSDVAGTFGFIRARAVGTGTGGTTASIALTARSTNASTAVQLIANTTTGSQGAAYGMYADGTHQWDVDNSQTGMTLARTNATLSLNGYLYPGTGTNSQSTGYIDWDGTNTGIRFAGSEVYFNYHIFPGSQAGAQQTTNFLTANTTDGTIIQLGDSGGGQAFIVRDSASATKFKVNSDGFVFVEAGAGASLQSSGATGAMPNPTKYLHLQTPAGTSYYIPAFSGFNNWTA